MSRDRKIHSTFSIFKWIAQPGTAAFPSSLNAMFFERKVVAWRISAQIYNSFFELVEAGAARGWPCTGVRAHILRDLRFETDASKHRKNNHRAKDFSPSTWHFLSENFQWWFDQRPWLWFRQEYHQTPSNKSVLIYAFLILRPPLPDEMLEQPNRDSLLVEKSTDVK